MNGIHGAAPHELAEQLFPAPGFVLLAENPVGYVAEVGDRLGLDRVLRIFRFVLQVVDRLVDGQPGRDRCVKLEAVGRGILKGESASFR